MALGFEEERVFVKQFFSFDIDLGNFKGNIKYSYIFFQLNLYFFEEFLFFIVIFVQGEGQKDLSCSGSRGYFFCLRV